eukprot:TRINITY_DN12439_c0_g1_i1.p1 TRINITY_DN12439_c0_g1~~TRINITY_DN12439_c0_g1_i1.p1  ORF type:complete len:163 (-),score=37.30 TRINITY_DN12439_c0_g1_i1:10-498(-)
MRFEEEGPGQIGKYIGNLIYGTLADFYKKLLVEIDSKFKLSRSSLAFLNNHEIVLETNSFEAETNCMILSNCINICLKELEITTVLPVSFKIGNNWGDMKVVSLEDVNIREIVRLETFNDLFVEAEPSSEEVSSSVNETSEEISESNTLFDLIDDFTMSQET